MLEIIIIYSTTLLIGLIFMGVAMSIICEAMDRRTEKWRRLKGL